MASLLQMSYFHQPCPEPMEHRVLFQLLDNRATEHPNKEAIVLYDVNRHRSSLSFGEWQTKSQSLAAALLDRGLRRGDNVGVLLPNSLEFVVILIALNRIGANTIAIPLEFSSDPDLTDITLRLNCVGLFCFLEEDVSKREALMETITKLSELRSEDDADVFKSIVTTGVKMERVSRRQNVRSYEQLLSTGASLDHTPLQKQQAKVQFDDSALVLFSSGSTGKPKACQLTNQSLVVGSMVDAFNMKVTSHSRVFCDSPFSWVPGISEGVALAPCSGATVVMVPPEITIKKRDTHFTLSVIQDERCSNCQLFPYLLYDVVDAGSETLARYDLDSFQYCVTGGQPVPEALIRKTLSLLPRLKVILGYGLTETYSYVAYQEIDSDEFHSDSYGWMKLGPHCEVKIVDEEDCLVPVGCNGEVCVRAPMNVIEFVDDSDATAKSISRTGWYRTSDSGIMNELGEIKIFGRFGDAINRGTDTFYVGEMEAMMAQHPSVSQVIVIPVPDQRLYEEICACVIPKDGFSVSDLNACCEQQWPESDNGLPWKPKYSVLLESFPRKTNGKADRKKLAEIAIEHLGLQTVE